MKEKRKPVPQVGVTQIQQNDSLGNLGIPANLSPPTPPTPQVLWQTAFLFSLTKRAVSLAGSRKQGRNGPIHQVSFITGTFAQSTQNKTSTFPISVILLDFIQNPQKRTSLPEGTLIQELFSPEDGLLV